MLRPLQPKFWSHTATHRAMHHALPDVACSMPELCKSCLHVQHLLLAWFKVTETHPGVCGCDSRIRCTHAGLPPGIHGSKASVPSCVHHRGVQVLLPPWTNPHVRNPQRLKSTEAADHGRRYWPGLSCIPLLYGCRPLIRVGAFQIHSKSEYDLSFKNLLF